VLRGFRSLLVVAAASAAALAAGRLPHHSQGPQPGHTGGFGEPDCRACHFDYPLNDGAATIRLDTLPGVYEPERTYALQLSATHPDLERGGFQLTARFEDGTQAGRFVISDSTVLRVQHLRGIDYLSHTLAGAGQVKNHEAVWRFDWVAPASDRRVVFNLAVNAANHDASEFGDRIFTRTFHSGAELIRK
jgi:hypothetical protein